MSIFKSRKFWLAIFDVVISFATYFLTKYAAPDLTKDLLFVLGGLQPVIISVIIGIAVEDAGEKSARIYYMDEAEE